jgi:hypothetical protein
MRRFGDKQSRDRLSGAQEALQDVANVADGAVMMGHLSLHGGVFLGGFEKPSLTFEISRLAAPGHEQRDVRPAAGGEQTNRVGAGSRIIYIRRRELHTRMTGTADDTRQAALAEPLLLGCCGKVEDAAGGLKLVNQGFEPSVGLSGERGMAGVEVQLVTRSRQVITECVYPKDGTRRQALEGER